ncbi:group III truncated hemoglobin [Mesonia sp. K7]|uniref:group III truncated hemoglobin n=1 Tax=Mesonia sp. K7 TaxID=2218606 RepID=UPI000DA8B851|nr:group III truncated hemoglobin [Mesonia sp. K7]PZD78262.1 sec-independent protein translocase TatC [Mesonia sp. K7]
MEKRLLENKDDIIFLVDEFYKQVLTDEKIGYIFTEVAQLDVKKHMPIMYNFWESALFGAVSYKGNPMIKHIELHQKSLLSSAHFERWLKLWENTVNFHFRGEKAEEAIYKAKQIAALMQLKIGQL